MRKTITVVAAALSLIVSIPAGAQQTPAATPLPLTRQLSKAFGNDHEVVQNTAFIQAALNHKLTKDQLLAHLQQRALVHQAVDQVLGMVQPPLTAYGDDQKNVITLLRQDLTALGSTWPTNTSAWPLTRDFIRTIQDSAKTGPYYALGVFHVYYGGITHGGRDIAAEIDKTLNTDLSYYLKSDGYSAYAKHVNEILAPDAQKEMIRGGVAAYQYIIAVNDVDQFKSK